MSVRVEDLGALGDDEVACRLTRRQRLHRVQQLLCDGRPVLDRARRIGGFRRPPQIDQAHGFGLRRQLVEDWLNVVVPQDQPRGRRTLRSRFERHPRARVQAALVFIMPWNPRQEPAGEPEDLGDHRAVLGQQRDIPGHPVGVGPNDPTVAVEDGWPMSRLREEQMVRSTDVVNPIDSPPGSDPRAVPRRPMRSGFGTRRRAAPDEGDSRVRQGLRAAARPASTSPIQWWTGAASGRPGTSHRNAGRVWRVRHKVRRAKRRRSAVAEAPRCQRFPVCRPDEYTLARAQSTGSLPVLSR